MEDLFEKFRPGPAHKRKSLDREDIHAVLLEVLMHAEKTGERLSEKTLSRIVNARCQQLGIEDVPQAPETFRRYLELHPELAKGRMLRGS